MVGWPSSRPLGDVYYGWIVTGACFTGLLAVFSINYSFSVFFDPLIADLQTSKADTSLVFSIQSITLYSSAAVFGRQVDRFSTRPLVLVGTVLLGIGMTGASQSGTLIELYVSYGLIAGVGMGIVYVIGITTATRWFQRRRGLASSVATSGVVMATLLAPPATSALIERYGWQHAYLLMTGTVVAVLVVVAALVRDDPESAGVDPGDEFLDGLAAEAASAGTSGTGGPSLGAVLRTRSFWAIFVAWITTTLPIFAVLVYLVTYSTDVGMARSTGVLAVALVGGFALPGRLLSGAIGDRFGRTRFFVVLALALGVGIWTLSAIRDPLVLLAFGVGYGLLYGGVGGLYTPIMADFFGRQQVTTFFGISATAFGIAAFTGPYLAGLSFEYLGSYTPFFLTSGILSLFGGVVLLVANRRWK
jgi:MFS family permease